MTDRNSVLEEAVAALERVAEQHDKIAHSMRNAGLEVTADIYVASAKTLRTDCVIALRSLKS